MSNPYYRDWRVSSEELPEIQQLLRESAARGDRFRELYPVVVAIHNLAKDLRKLGYTEQQFRDAMKRAGVEIYACDRGIARLHEELTGQKWEDIRG